MQDTQFKVRRALLASSLLVAARANAQDYPTKPISIVVPFPPGGAAANIPLVVSEKVTRDTGVRMILEHKPGAGSLVGTLDVKNGPKDGYRVLMLASTLAATLALREDTGITVNDFVPLVRLAKDYFVLVAGPALRDRKVESMREFLDAARRSPGALNLGSPGVGTTLHLGAEKIADDFGIKLNRVDYQGMAPMYVDLIGGRLDLIVDVLGNAMRYHGKEGVRVLAVAAPSRVATANDIPTLAEFGLKDSVLETWWGLAVPTGTPPARIAYLEKIFMAVARDPETRQRIAATGTIPTSDSGPEMKEILERDYRLWSSIVKQHKISLK